MKIEDGENASKSMMCWDWVSGYRRLRKPAVAKEK
jgi:hypothetical protein